MMFISWTVFDSNISYSRWKWPTFIPYVPLKTLCQLISGCSYGLKLGILYPQIRVDSKFFWLASAGRVLNPHTFKYVTPRLPTCRPRSFLSYEYERVRHDCISGGGRTWCCNSLRADEAALWVASVMAIVVVIDDDDDDWYSYSHHWTMSMLIILPIEDFFRSICALFSIAAIHWYCD